MFKSQALNRRSIRAGRAGFDGQNLTCLPRVNGSVVAETFLVSRKVDLFGFS